MFSKFAHNTTRLSFISFSSLFNLDNIPVSQIQKEPNEVIEETGWDRVKRMYTADEFGNITPEANSILQVGMISAVFGGLYGGFRSGQSAYDQFMRNNTATTFENHMDAKRKLQDHMTINFSKGAFRWSWRLALLSMSILGMTTTLQVYRNKYGITEYAVAGGTCGALYKFNLGPKGWLAGGLIGSGLGLVCGALTVGLLNLAGVSMQEAHLWRYKIRESRMEMKKKGFQKDYDKQEFAVIKSHDQAVGEKGHNINILDDNVKDNNEKVETSK